MTEIIDRRPSWDEYFMTLADEVCTRTTCTRRAVGAVIVKDHRILCTGYNGVPTGMHHCAEVGCLRETCAKMLINAGIAEIIFKNPYPDELSMSMLDEAGMKHRVFKPAEKEE